MNLFVHEWEGKKQYSAKSTFGSIPLPQIATKSGIRKKKLKKKKHYFSNSFQLSLCAVLPMPLLFRSDVSKKLLRPNGVRALNHQTNPTRSVSTRWARKVLREKELHKQPKQAFPTNRYIVPLSKASLPGSQELPLWLPEKWLSFQGKNHH